MILKNSKNNIFIIGPTGVGKSTIGYNLSNKLNKKFFDSDKELEKYFNMNINNIFKKNGEKKFRFFEKKIINNILKEKNIILSTGGGSIENKYIRNLLSNNGIVIYLMANIKTQLTRLNNFNDRPLLINKNKYEKENILKKLDNIRNELYNSISDIIIDTNKKNINEIIDNILNILNINNFIIKNHENNKC
ncbi:shikimate kinase [endosymbiont of Pachyrhynchus infernalis]|uniref:shikimate kinase n=1 Tax=endosymbiont of Pachyrhynchus infernalis TaxID=1971488 RepID=UPI0038B4FDEF